MAGPKHDLGHSVDVLWLWVLPIVGLITTSALVNTNRIALQLAGLLFVAGTLWIAAGCFLNARACGRVHCRLASAIYPLLAIAGLAYVAGLIHPPHFWDWYWGTFLVVLAIGFGLERFFGKYG